MSDHCEDLLAGGRRPPGILQGLLFAAELFGQPADGGDAEQGSEQDRDGRREPDAELDPVRRRTGAAELVLERGPPVVDEIIETILEHFACRLEHVLEVRHDRSGVRVLAPAANRLRGRLRVGAARLADPGKQLPLVRVRIRL